MCRISNSLASAVATQFLLLLLRRIIHVVSQIIGNKALRIRECKSNLFLLLIILFMFSYNQKIKMCVFIGVCGLGLFVLRIYVLDIIFI